MKVLQINVLANNRSTGRTTFELHNFLVDKNHQSFVACALKEGSNYDGCFRVCNRFEYYLSNVLSRIFGDEGFHSVIPTLRLIKKIKRIKPDIIHLRNLHSDYINLPLLLKYIAKQDIATVITTHDFWFFCGICTNASCEKYKTGCYKCPHFKRSKRNLFFDRSKYCFKKKKKLFLSIPRLAIQANSYFSESVVSESFLKNNYITTIYNWIDLSVFYHEDVDNSVFGISNSKKTFLIVFGSFNKNSPYLIDFFKFSQMMGDGFNYVVVGKIDFDKNEYPGLAFMGSTNDVNLLRKYYSAASILINPSKEDTFGKTVSESLACGTPCIVYKGRTALPELIKNLYCGSSAPMDSINDICLEANRLLSLNQETIRKRCREVAETFFNKETNCNKIIEVYNYIYERKDSAVNKE